MKHVFRIATLAAAIAALTLAAPAAAQQAARGDPRLGIGVALSNFDVATLFTGSGAAQIYVPINLTPTLRLEPHFGYVSVEDDADPTNDFSSLTIGIGALFTSQVAPQVLAYVGPRLSLSFASETVGVGGGATTDADRTDFRIAAAFGGEYQFSPRFSIGAEGQLGYLAIGDTDLGPLGEEPGGSSVQTSALVFFRVYMF